MTNTLSRPPNNNLYTFRINHSISYLSSLIYKQIYGKIKHEKTHILFITYNNL